MMRWILLAGLGAAAANAEGLREIRGAAAMVLQTPFVYSGALLLLALGVWFWRRRAPIRPGKTLPDRDSLAALAAEYRRSVRSGGETLLLLDALLRARLDALTYTTPEMLARAHVPAQFEPLLALLDRVKFAAHIPDAEEVEHALALAAAWLEATEGRT